MAKRQAQIQVLEEARGAQELSVPAFAEALGVTRQWYYRQLDRQSDVLDLQRLSFMAVDHAGEWRGDLAVRCIRLIDARFVPCPCQTEPGDHGACPRHGVFVPAEREPVEEMA